MKLWLKWEVIDITALTDAIDIKSKLEVKKQQRI